MGIQFDPQMINEKLYMTEHIYQTGPLPEVLGDQERRRYAADGFLAYEQLINEEMVEDSKRALTEIILSSNTSAGVQYSEIKAKWESDEEREFAVRKVNQFVGADKRLQKIAEHPVLIGFLESLLGSKVKLVQDMALLKPPHGGGEKPWHQDMAYGPLTFDKPVIGVWIALDQATKLNGCMHIIPGSHARGGVPHYSVRDWQICDTHVRTGEAVAVPLEPGGVLLFHGLLHHGTPYNFSSERRRALQFHYVINEAEKITSDEFKRIFTNEMTNAEC